MNDLLIPDGVKKLSSMFCGCGLPESAWEIVLRLLGYFGTPHEDRNLDEFRDEDYLAAYVIDHCGLIEHGTSIGGSWLTDDGKEALRFLRKHGVEWGDLPGAEEFVGRWVWEPAE